MRDLERWKDKVELSLDGRQIFFLFFGSAVAACLIFVLGVVVGKRMEARALVFAPAPADDPLAALDQLGDAEEQGLTFHATLTHERPAKEGKGEPRKALPDESAGGAEVTAPPKLELKKSDKKTESPKIVDKKTEAPRSLPSPPEVPELATADKVADQGAEKGAVKLAEPAVAKSAVKPVDKSAEPSADKIGDKGGDKTKVSVKKLDLKKNDPGQAHFTLQLSAFPVRGDAEEFMRKIQTAGYHPFLVASEIPGRGIFYRVRVGDFGSRQAAIEAKGEFERKQRMIAYVAKL